MMGAQTGNKRSLEGDDSKGANQQSKGARGPFNIVTAQGINNASGGKGEGKSPIIHPIIEFQIHIIGRKHDAIDTESWVYVTAGMTLAQLKERMIGPLRNEYQFDPGHYRGQHEMLMEHITVQEMRMESGSPLIFFSLRGSGNGQTALRH